MQVYITDTTRFETRPARRNPSPLTILKRNLHDQTLRTLPAPAVEYRNLLTFKRVSTTLKNNRFGLELVFDSSGEGLFGRCPTASGR